jgi:hypothetical protein
MPHTSYRSTLYALRFPWVFGAGLCFLPHTSCRIPHAAFVLSNLYNFEKVTLFNQSFSIEGHENKPVTDIILKNLL